MSENTMRVMRVPSADDHRIVRADLEKPEPGPGQIRIRVEACGICHSDVLTVNNLWPGITFPRAPGHEAAGVVDKTGEGVVGFKTGDRVGLGWHGGYCGHCDRCRRGDFFTCRFAKVSGISFDGGYSEYVVAQEGVVAHIPDGLSAQDAAPLMCAGVTTFNSLRHSAARAGDLVAVLGIGGLGHLGVQYAAKMGFETVAIARGRDKEQLARDLGAHHYIDSTTADPAAELQKLGGAKVVLSTVTAGAAMEAVIPGLGVEGCLLVVGASHEPLSVDSAAMIGQRNEIKAWPSGTCVDSEDTLKFSVLSGIRPMVETFPFDRAQEGYDRMMSGAARFRVVLT